MRKNGIALGSIFVITLVMGDFYVVKVMSGGNAASVVAAMYDAIATSSVSARCRQRRHPYGIHRIAGEP